MHYKRPLPAAALFLAAASPLLAQDLPYGWRADGVTDAVALDRVEQSPGYQTLFLKNISTRYVTAVGVSFTSGGSREDHYMDYLEADTGYLAPGASWALGLAPPDRLGNSDGLLHIDAVVFAGGGAEGLPTTLSFIEFKRLGRAFEAARVSAILADEGDAALADDAPVRLARRISALPETIDQACASLSAVRISGASADGVMQAGHDSQVAFLAGVRTAREDGQFKVRQLAELPVASTDPKLPSRSAFLQQLKQLYAAKLAVLGAFVGSGKGGQLQ